MKTHRDKDGIQLRQTITLLRIGLRQVMRDGMLLVLLPAPILIGLTAKLALPFANRLLEEEYSFSLFPWYGLADGTLLCLTPMLTAMAMAFLLLEERDDGLSAFYHVTPAAGCPYLLARIGIPLMWAFLMTSAVAGIFGISGLSAAVILCCSLISTLMGTALAMMLVALAANRVEGLALSKLMGISLLGLIAVWVVPEPYHYLFALLPSFWIGTILTEGPEPFPLTIAFSLCAFWVFIFTRMFLRQPSRKAS
jgi:fluoroquinolone transport system permease protein